MYYQTQTYAEARAVTAPANTGVVTGTQVVAAAPVASAGSGKQILLQGLSSGERMVATPASGGHVPQLIAKYDELERQVEALRSATSDTEMSGGNVQKIYNAIESNNKKVAGMRKKLGDVEGRLKRNAKKPTLFGMQGNKRGVLFRNQGKIEELEHEKEELEKNIAKGEARIKQQEQELAQARNVHKANQNRSNDRAGMVTQMREILEQVVASQPPTQSYLNAQAEYKTIKALKVSLDAVFLKCNQAMELYQKSAQLQRQAGASNVGAMVARNDGAERLMQLRRDKMMQAAVQPAEEASKLLANTLADINPAIRQRYPELMARVGNIPMANLAVGHFGRDVLVGAAFGDTGDALNQINHARKVAKNKQELEKCMGIASEQIRYIQIVEDTMAREMKEEGEKIEFDKQTVFQTQRSLYSTGAVAPASSSSYTQPTAAQAGSFHAAPQPTYQAAPQPAYQAAPQPAYQAAPQPAYQAAPQLAYQAAAAPPPAAAMPPVAASQNFVTLKQNHTVDEANPAFASNNIISVPKGTVELVNGDLVNGLGGAFKDYIEVRYNGRVGKVSRLIAVPAAGAPVPVAAAPAPAAYTPAPASTGVATGNLLEF